MVGISVPGKARRKICVDFEDVGKPMKNNELSKVVSDRMDDIKNAILEILDIYTVCSHGSQYNEIGIESSDKYSSTDTRDEGSVFLECQTEMFLLKSEITCQYIVL